MTRPYPSYKDSGIPGVGLVPRNWSAARVKHVASCNDEVLPEDTASEQLIDYVEISGVDPTVGIMASTRVAFSEASPRARRKVRDGDILVSTVRTYLRAIAQVSRPPDNMIASTGFAVVRPRRASSGFLGYLFTAEFMIGEIISRSVGVSYPAITASEIMGLKIPVPPLVEQRAIVAFLDRETGKIDAAVEEQRRLIALLKEKRQAVISHAVTKGLNPDARMKPSGIDWLGDIPEHWGVVALKRLCNLLRDGTHLPPARVDDGVPLLSVRNIIGLDFRFRDDDSMISEDEFLDLCRSFVPRAGDVLLAVVGATLGKPAIVPEGMGNFHIQRSLAIFRPGDRITSEWLFNFFQSASFQRLIWSSVGFSAQPGIYLGRLAEARIAVPPPKERDDIVARINAQTSMLDALISEAETAIDLLQERRSAMISAAVTGKIDVRGEVAEQQREQSLEGIEASVGA